jgi:hypothetical protein
MKSKMWSLILTTGVVAALLCSAIPAHATFPGKNGRIAFVFGPDIYTMNPGVMSDSSPISGWTVRPIGNLGHQTGS